MQNQNFSLKDYILNNSYNSSSNNSYNNSCNNFDKNKCSSCNNNVVINYCLNDNDILCNDCTKQHSKSHNIISYREFKESTLFLNYHEFTESYSNINQYNLEMDKKNKLFYFDINSKEITFGSKWSECGMNSNDPFLIVSFSGFSGSGKSTIIGSLISNSNDHPIPGKESSTNSTSSDINSFLGQTVNEEGEKFKYLILDSEGIGGTSIPLFIEEEFNKLKNVNCDQESKKLKKDIKSRRSNVVQLLYPKLLTIISDIIIFTFKGSPKEKSNVFKQIKKLTYISSSNSNIQFKPHLIILLNKQTTPIFLDDIEYATNDYFSGSEEENLNQFSVFFKSISVIYIPNIKENNNNSFKRYQSQIVKLKELISIKIIESLNYKKSINFNYTKDESMSKIKKVIKEFNSNREFDNSFDFRLYDISSSLNRSINQIEEFKIPDQCFRKSLNNSNNKNKNNINSSNVSNNNINNNNYDGSINDSNSYNNNNESGSASSKNEETAIDNSPLTESIYYVSNVPVIGLHRKKNSHFIFKKTLTSSISSLSTLPASTLCQLNNLVITPHQSFSEEYSTPIKESNNYTKIISNTLISNIIISNYLTTYFKLCYYKLIESGVTRRESFYLAKIKIKSRILSIFNIFKSRNYLDENNIFEDALDIFSQDVDQLVPCKQIISNLECINLKNSHHYHQTKQHVDKDINFNEKRKRTIKIPYIEQGKFDPLYRYEDFKIYLKKAPIKTDLYYLDFKNCYDVCIGCFLEEPIVKLKCGHIVCTSCSLEYGSPDECFIDQCCYTL